MKNDYEKNAQEPKDLNYSDLQDVIDSLRGFCTKLDPPVIYSKSDKGSTKRAIWDLKKYDFIPDINKVEDYKPDDCPPNVHPSLWRQAKLNKIHGLFKVCEGVYQVRGYDIANLTIVEGKEGITIIDCTTAVEIAEESIALYRKYKAKEAFRPIKALIYTHSHSDHYGGALGVVKDTKNLTIIAPENFAQEVTIENAFAGDSMIRRSSYQFGTYLDKNLGNHIDCGLGKMIQLGGMVSYEAPTHTVVKNAKNKDEISENKSYEIDGKHYEFMLALETEAPSEMTVYIEEGNVLVNAEISNHTLHNLLTPRGAQIRDARLWWKALDRLLERYKGKLEVICATHNWPTWSNDRCKKFLIEQRDTYKFLHDQTVRLMNKGYTMLEIAAEFNKKEFLPDFMKNKWHNRGYYGSISHDVRAVYQKYLGWYDMNPANLDPLPPEEVAVEYVKSYGGEEALLAIINKAQTDGKLRWAAELGKHLVFANPNEKNRKKLAEIYKTLAYQCEAATWRNMYLTGAVELEKNGPIYKADRIVGNPTLLETMNEDLLFDFVATRFISEGAMGESGIKFFIKPKEIKDTYFINASSGVLNFYIDKVNDLYNTLELDRKTLVALILRTNDLTLEKAIKEGSAIIKLAKNVSKNEAIEYISKFFDLIERIPANFNIAQP